jgi:hypothetical protein
MSEKDCEYVSSRGLLKSCDVTYKQEEIPTNTDFGALPDLNNLYDNCSLYVRTESLNHFADNIIDTINHKFILVSGDTDEENYVQTFRRDYDKFEKFISNEKIIHWFCQNSTIAHPKISNLPIGLDYHGSKNFSPIDQEKELKNIKSTSEYFDKRICKCYINFNYPPDGYIHAYDRKEALNEIPTELIHKETPNIKTYETWTNQTKFAFVVSPFGNGLDCHRTWEALILGCIPIIRSSAMNPLFDDLPVLLIEKWSDITQELLDSTIEKFKNRSFNYDKLLLKYWVDRINSYKKTENFTTNIHNQNKVSYEYIIYFVLILFLFLLFFFILKNIYLLRKVKNIIVKAIHRK